MWFTYPKEVFPYIPQMLLLESFKQYYSYSPKLETNQINAQHCKVWSIHIVYYKAKKKECMISSYTQLYWQIEQRYC